MNGGDFNAARGHVTTGPGITIAAVENLERSNGGGREAAETCDKGRRPCGKK